MQSGSEFGHLLFDILVLGALLLQLLFHLVERLHHVLFLLGLCVTFTLLLLKLLLQLVVLCDEKSQCYLEFTQNVILTGKHPFSGEVIHDLTNLFSFSRLALSIV